MKLNRLEEAFLLVTEVQCIIMPCHATWNSADLVGYPVTVVRPERSMTTRDGRCFALRVFIRHLFFPFSFLGLVAVALAGAICSQRPMERCWKVALPRYPFANGSTTKTGQPLKHDQSTTLEQSVLPLRPPDNLNCVVRGVQISFHQVMMIWNDVVGGGGRGGLPPDEMANSGYRASPTIVG